MNTIDQKKFNFGNWVPGKMIFIPGILALLCFGLGFLQWGWWIPAALFLLVTVYFTVSRVLFSVEGGNIQNKVQELIISQLQWDGKGEILDIGCGNGPLSIKTAKRFPQAKITGVDTWGKNWDYANQVCQQNSRLAGVTNLHFQQGSAAALPFEDASFDVVVSNLTFHEVREIKDKRHCLQEALRVLKPGGLFVLQDLFLLQRYYGEPRDLVSYIKQIGAIDTEFIRTCDEAFIPRWVKLPFMLGAMACIHGKKRTE
jgi:ubiquinone/menaquinone biosynthesis C-methylase UbiE